MKDLENALTKFETAAENHEKASETGDYKTGNKNYKELIKAVNYLKAQNEILLLSKFFDHSSVGVRIWAATYMLPIKEDEATKVLENIAKEDNFHAFTAKLTLQEWQKGNLKL